MGIVVTVKEAQERLPELLARVREGESVVLAVDGEPVARLLPAAEADTAEPEFDRFAIGRAWLAERGIDRAFPYVAPDFDDPLPEDFLVGPDDGSMIVDATNPR